MPLDPRDPDDWKRIQLLRARRRMTEPPRDYRVREREHFKPADGDEPPQGQK